MFHSLSSRIELSDHILISTLSRSLSFPPCEDCKRTSYAFIRIPKKHSSDATLSLFSSLILSFDRQTFCLILQPSSPFLLLLALSVACLSNFSSSFSLFCSPRSSFRFFLPWERRNLHDRISLMCFPWQSADCRRAKEREMEKKNEKIAF